MNDFWAGYADQTSTNKAIGDIYKSDSYLMDTHTAVAYKVYEDYKKATGDESPVVIAATASAYKFAESVSEAIGLVKESDGFTSIQALHEKTGTRVPRELQNLKDKKILHNTILEKDGLIDAVRGLF